MGQKFRLDSSEDAHACDAHVPAEVPAEDAQVPASPEDAHVTCYTAEVPAEDAEVRQHQNMGGAEDAEDAQVRQQKITRRCSG